MQRTIAAAATAVVLALAGVHRVGAQQGTVTVDVTGAMGASVLDIAMNGGKIADIQPDPQGTGTTTVDLANAGKAQVQVFVDRCQNGQVVRVQLVTDGRTPPRDENCDRKLAGVFWAHRARRLAIDIPAGTMQVANSGMSTAMKAGLGAAGGVGALIALAAGGGDVDAGSAGMPSTPLTPAPNPAPNPTPPPAPTTPVFNPAGNYPSTISLQSDPGGHGPFIALPSSLVLTVALSGTTMTISGPGGSNWVTVTGPYDATTRRATLTGTGTVAGRSNVGVRFDVTFSESGALTGTLVMGTGGELPGGSSTTYGVAGQRQ